MIDHDREVRLATRRLQHVQALVASVELAAFEGWCKITNLGRLFAMERAAEAELDAAIAARDAVTAPAVGGRS